MHMKKTKQIFNWFKAKKRRWLGALLVVLIIFLIGTSDGKSGKTDSILDTVARGDLKKTVLATGQVTSTTDVSLGFNTTDTVASVRVKVGDKVTGGQILATLNNQDELASLTTARGALLSAQAHYNKVLAGASGEEITVAEVAKKNAETDLANTVTTQDTLVKNAHRALLNTGLTASPNQTSTVADPTISGIYNQDKEGTLIITVYTSGSTGYFVASGIASGTGPTDASSPVAIGTTGLFIDFPDSFVPPSGALWTINIPNTQSSGYVAAYNAYESAKETRGSAVASAQSLVDARSADLALKKAAARAPDIEVAQADVLSAEGRVQTAQVAYDNTILRAPGAGTITTVDTKIGELVSLQKEVMVLQDISNLYLEANINEANISEIKLAQPVEITFDAFGPNEKFQGLVTHIDPSATIQDGVVNYKINVSIPQGEERIRPGMNANMTIIAGTYPNVLYVPLLAISRHDNKTFLTVLVDQKGKKTTEHEVVLGAMGDGNLVEIASGATEGERIKIISK